MEKIRRRDFLRGSSMAVAAGGLMVALPGVPSLLTVLEEDSPEVDTSAGVSSEEAMSMSEPIVARVTNLSTGEMQMFFGKQEITFNDPQIAARLFQATRLSASG